MPEKGAHPTHEPLGNGERGRLTYDDYCRTPDDVRYELVEGELRMVPSPVVSHQEVSGRLHLILEERLGRPGKGKVLYAPCDVVLSRHNVLQPDLLFVARSHLDIIGKANIQGPPDLIIEILSPSTADWDRVTKRSVYARYGVREFWTVDLEAKAIEVATLQPSEASSESGGQDLIAVGVYPVGAVARSPLFPEFKVDVAELMADLPGHAG